MTVNMKSQKGITLISLTVYIIVMTIVVGTVSLISSHFYTNIRDSVNTVEPLTQYTKLNSFITEEINRPNIKVLEFTDKVPELMSISDLVITKPRRNHIVRSYSIKCSNNYNKPNTRTRRRKCRIFRREWTCNMGKKRRGIFKNYKRCNKR